MMSRYEKNSMLLIKISQPINFDDVGLIPLSGGSNAIVDLEDFENLSQYTWYKIKQHGRPYAARKVCSKGSVHWVRMHRQIMHTPKGQVVHHKNRQGLDNRKANLQNMTDADHTELHRYHIL